MNDYYTHRPYLIQILEGFDYSKNVNILEFGTGEGSGEVFHQFASLYSNLNIQSFDNDITWLNTMKNKYQLPNYNFTQVESWKELFDTYNFSSSYDLIFVDQSPWEARIMSLDFLKGKYQTAILHDYDYYNKGITPPNKIYDTDESSYFAKYLDAYTLQGYHSTLPPTLTFSKH